VVSGNDAGGGAKSAVQKRTTVPVSKSTAKVMEYFLFLWLCEHARYLLYYYKGTNTDASMRTAKVIGCI
jgi:hypothetical protein